MERTRFRFQTAYVTILLGSFFLLAYAYSNIYYPSESVQDDFGYWYGGNSVKPLKGTTRSQSLYDFFFGEELKPQDDIWDILHFAILTIGETMQLWVDHQPMSMFQTKQELEHLETSWVNKIIRFFTSATEAEVPEPGYSPSDVINSIYTVLDASKWSTATAVMVTLTTVLSAVYMWTLHVDAQKAQLAKKDQIIKSNQKLATAYMCFTRKKYNAVKKNYRLKVNELKDQLKVKEAEIGRYKEFVDIAAARMEEQDKTLHEMGKMIEVIKWGKVVSTD